MFRRSLRHPQGEPLSKFSKLYAYYKVVRIVELQSVKYFICVFFYKVLQLLKHIVKAFSWKIKKIFAV